MATFTYEVPDEDASRVVSALCIRGGFNAAEHNLTPEQFAKQAVASWLSQTVVDVEREQALSAAAASLQPGPTITIT